MMMLASLLFNYLFIYMNIWDVLLLTNAQKAAIHAAGQARVGKVINGGRWARLARLSFKNPATLPGCTAHGFLSFLRSRPQAKSPMHCCGRARN